MKKTERDGNGEGSREGGINSKVWKLKGDRKTGKGRKW